MKSIKEVQRERCGVFQKFGEDNEVGTEEEGGERGNVTLIRGREVGFKERKSTGHWIWELICYST